MYKIGKSALRQLGPDGKNRKNIWYGTMTTETGTVYEINTDIIGRGTGKVNKACSLPFIGGAYSASFQAQFLMRDVDPNTLKNAKIELFVKVIHPEFLPDSMPWEKASEYTWRELLTTTWGGKNRLVYTEIPIGVFYVVDAKRSMYSIKIESSDSMVKFDTDLPGIDSTSRSVYGWLQWACNSCGVKLGMTETQIKSMPNGTRNLVYAVIDSKIKTYRDLISYLAAVLGSVAMIDRHDCLILKTVNSEPIANLTPNDRFTSEYEDTKYKYTGLSLVYKAKGIKEYFRNTDAMSDTGQVVDLGENPFLQIANDSARNAAVQKIINSVAGITLNPFKASIPFHPEFDLLDMISFSDGHAPEDCHGIITRLTIAINGGVSLECETPKGTKEQERKNVQISGTSESRVSGGDMWIKISSDPKEKFLIAAGAERFVAELIVNCPTDNTTMQIAWTGCYTLEEDATVIVGVFVDNKEIYSVSDEQKAGKHTMNVTTGHSVSSRGEYAISITVKEVSK